MNFYSCLIFQHSLSHLQAGILHASEEKDFKTAFSYFYEAFEGYDSIDDKLAIKGLKYMLMSKIMLNTPDEVLSIVSGKLALKYSGSDIDAMKAIALAAKERSLADFQTTLKRQKRELEEDAIVQKHLGKLYQTMLEQNLCRIIEPYSKIQVSSLFLISFKKFKKKAFLSNNPDDDIACQELL